MDAALSSGQWSSSVTSHFCIAAILFTCVVYTVLVLPDHQEVYRMTGMCVCVSLCVCVWLLLAVFCISASLAAMLVMSC